MKPRRDFKARIRFEPKDGLLYVEVKDGRRYRPIARRDSGEAWQNLEPGFVVYGSEPGGDYGRITIEFHPERARAQ
jgi:hypothetical protein